MASTDSQSQKEQKSATPLLENGYSHPMRNSAPEHHSESQPRKTTLWHKTRLVASFLFGVAWLGPAIWLLYSNLSEYVIGGNVWCPSGDCSIVTFSLPIYQEDSSAINNAVEADRQAHSLLGALQFVAKAIEIWFIVLAGSLIYTVARYIAKSEGLPLGYLLSHMEFVFLGWVLHPRMLVWGSGDGKHAHKIRAFLALIIFLSIMSVFIGPLTAVLLNPTLDWDNGEEAVHGRFVQMLSQGPSRNGMTNRNDAFVNSCENDNLLAGEYSCLDAPYTVTQNALFENVDASISQGTSSIPKANETIIWYNLYTSENLLRFSFNNTPSPRVEEIFGIPSLSPNRQLLRGFANDIWSYMNYTFGLASAPVAAFGASARHANDSVQLELQRQGPIIGSTYFLEYGIPHRAVIGDGRQQIRCFEDLLEINPGQRWAKCYRYGSWSPDSGVANLTFRGPIPNNPDAFTNLEFYWSDKFAYFSPDDFQPWRSTCMRNFTSMDDFNAADNECHWEDNFNRAAPQNYQSATAGFVTEFRIRNEYPRVPISELNPSVASATYSVDVTDIFSSSMEVTLPDVRPSGTDQTPIVLNATWALANWATSNGRTINTVGRHAASMIHTATHGAYPILPRPNLREPRSLDQLRLQHAAQLMGLHMLTLVTFDTTDTIEPEDSEDDALRPVFKSYFHRQVWKYGVEQRTRTFGIVITILGCMVALAYSALVFLDEEKPSTVELLRGAIEYQPSGDKGEFEGKRGVRQSGKVRFVVTQDESKKVSFQKP